MGPILSPIFFACCYSRKKNMSSRTTMFCTVAGLQLPRLQLSTRSLIFPNEDTIAGKLPAIDCSACPISVAAPRPQRHLVFLQPCPASSNPAALVPSTDGSPSHEIISPRTLAPSPPLDSLIHPATLCIQPNFGPTTNPQQSDSGSSTDRAAHGPATRVSIRRVMTSSDAIATP